MKHKRMVLVGVVAGSVAVAQIVGPLPVYDAAANLNVLISHAKFATQIVNQGVQIQHALDTYKHFVYQAKAISGQVGRWGYNLIPWRNTTASDLAGVNGGYLAAINSGAGTSGGYQQTVESLATLTPLLYGTQAMQDRARRRYGAVELSDGTSKHAMGVIGRLRAEEPGMRAKVTALSQASTSDDPALNTAAAIANKANNAAVLSLQNMVAQNDLIAAHAELMLQQQTRERQQAAVAVNEEIYFRQNAAATAAHFNAGTTAAYQGLTIP